MITTRLKQLFMSKEQIIYLIMMFVSCIIYGMFAASFTFYQIGAGARYFAATTIVGCVVGCIHALVSADVKKKRWVFMHYRAIDLSETIFFTITELSFFIYYGIVYGYGKLDIDTIPHSIFLLIFYQGIFYRIVNAIINTVIPSIGDVFEQSLYSNQIDYQNHSNAERLMCCFGAAVGALACFCVGNFFIERPYLQWVLVFLDWITIWSRWQFYYKPSNYSIIIRRFAKDSGEKMRQMYKENKTWQNQM